jgi:hypothetical protein
VIFVISRSADERPMNSKSISEAPVAGSRRLGQAQAIHLSVGKAAIVCLESRVAGRTSGHVGRTLGRSRHGSSFRDASSDKMSVRYLSRESPSPPEHPLSIYKLGVER